MKYCPICYARFDDSNSFCLRDGTTLFSEEHEPETILSQKRSGKNLQNENVSPNYVSYIIIAVLGFIIIGAFATLILWNSGRQNQTVAATEPQNTLDNVKLKEKELELREKELELKRKELEAKNTDVPAQKQSSALQVEKPLPPSRANSSSIYSGSVGNSASTFTLSWNKNKTVTGSFYYNGSQNDVYTISGSNVPEGQASIDVFDGSRAIGTMKLFKSISGNKICWTGSYYQSGGGSAPVSLCRYR